MKLYPTHDLYHWNTHFPDGIEQTTLANGQVLKHHWWLTGGGNTYRNYLLPLLRKQEKTWNRTFEWCCGHGVLGFEILSSGLCQQLVLSDYYDLAVQTCLQNAEQLGYPDCVNGYITPSIAEIPSHEVWDLVVGNPPNVMDEEGQRNFCTQQGQSQEMIDLALRITIDHQLDTHRDFFTHISQHLRPGADVWLTVSRPHLENLIQPMVESLTSLELQEVYPMDGLELAHWINP